MVLKLKFIALSLIGIFFFIVGIFLLISAYQQSNPFVFIITFFASNLMILISATLTLGFVMQLIRAHRNPSNQSQDDGP